MKRVAVWVVRRNILGLVFPFALAVGEYCRLAVVRDVAPRLFGLRRVPGHDVHEPQTSRQQWLSNSVACVGVVMVCMPWFDFLLSRFEQELSFSVNVLTADVPLRLSETDQVA